MRSSSVAMSLLRTLWPIPSCAPPPPLPRHRPFLRTHSPHHTHSVSFSPFHPDSLLSCSPLSLSLHLLSFPTFPPPFPSPFLYFPFHPLPLPLFPPSSLSLSLFPYPLSPYPSLNPFPLFLPPPTHTHQPPLHPIPPSPSPPLPLTVT